MFSGVGLVILVCIFLLPHFACLACQLFVRLWLVVLGHRERGVHEACLASSLVMAYISFALFKTFYGSLW